MLQRAEGAATEERLPQLQDVGEDMSAVSLADEEAVKKVLVDSVLGSLGCC